MNHRQARVLCFVFAGVFLIAAWWPFMPFPRNQVSWLAGRHGLAFGRPGVAYDPEPLPTRDADSSGSDAPGFTVELSLEAANEPGGNFPHIVTIHDGRTPSIFVIGQWQSELIVRVPAPERPRRTREAGIQGLRKGEPHVVVISGDLKTTTFYLDGRLLRQRNDFGLPLGSIRGQLIVGNAAAGKSAWSGSLFGLAIFNRALDAKEVAAHQAVWARGAVHELAGEPGLAALYSFAEGAGQQVSDYSPNQHHLFIPSDYVVLYKTVLGNSRSVVPRDWYAAKDIVLNLLGFVPFGFLTFIYYRGASTGQWLRAVIVATLAGGGLSLVIEVGQVWLPTRDSSLLDLALNTAGTGVGALLAGSIYGSRPRG
jgi:VanZ family protein